MLVREILFEDSDPYTYHPYPSEHIPIHLNVQNVSFRQTLAFEEKEMFNNLGIDTFNLKIPVVYSHIVKSKDNPGRLHAVKMRTKDKKGNPIYHKMHPKDLQQMIEDSVTEIVYGEGSGLRNRQLEGLKIVRQIIDTKDHVLLPAPSSAPLTMMFTKRLQEETGGEIMNVLRKSTESETKKSKYKFTKKEGYTPMEERNPGSLRTQLKNLEPNKLDQIHQQLQKAKTRWATEFSRGSIGREKQAKELQDYIADLQHQANTYEPEPEDDFKKKNYQYSGGDIGRVYNYIKGGLESDELDKRSVVIIDDNIISGQTIAECYKALLRRRIIPSRVCGICVHKYN